MTQRVDLRTGTPVWHQHRAPAVAHEPQSTHASFDADVLVIGAGISGALTADTLAEAGFSVLMVDRRGPIKGSSAASTALLQADLDVPLTTLTRMIGERDAVRHYRRSKMAVQALAERTKRHGIDADLVPRDSLYLSGDVLNAEGLKREATARRRAGLELSLVTRNELRDRYGIRRSAALQAFGNFAANPVKLTGGFLNAALARGVQIVAPMEIDALTETARSIVATSKSGVRIRAQYAVYASGYEMPRGVPKKKHRLSSTWAIATKPQRRALWPTECLLWEAADPYLYLRTTSDGRIICGGEDEDFKDEAARDALLPAKTKALERKLHSMFPSVDARPDYAWAGTFGVTPTGTPSIGFLPRKKRTLAVLGYGGNGFTFSMIAAQVVRGLLTKQGDPDADLYAFREH